MKSVDHTYSHLTPRVFTACWAPSHDAVIWAFKVVGLGFYPD